MPLAVEEIENIEPETLKKREKGYNQFLNLSRLKSQGS